MQEVFLRLVEIAPAPNGVWEAELWSDYPGHANHRLLAGGNLNNPPARFTQAQLEAPGAHGVDLSSPSVENFLSGVAGAVPRMVDAIGLRLYDLLEIAGVAQTWMQLRTNSAGVRTYLSVGGLLARWPWEVLARRVNHGVQPMFLEHRYPTVRVHSTFPQPLSWTDQSVRVLLISGQPQLDSTSEAGPKSVERVAEAIGVDEFRKIRGALHDSYASVLVHLCEAPVDEPALTRWIDEFNPHILHFIGHGMVQLGPTPEFALLFNPPPRPPQPGGAPVRPLQWTWSAAQMGQYFRNQSWKPRLIVLNACHAAGLLQHAVSVAESLLDAGVGAVVGSPAELGILNARRFAAEYYKRLPELPPNGDFSAPLDVAAVKARETIWLQSRSDRDWALPVLTVTAPLNGIVRFRRANSELISCDVVGEVFVRRGRFVSRAADRWKIISTFRPENDDPVYPGLILMGDKGLGKTWLMKRAAREFLDSGFVLSHAVLNGKKTGASSLEVLSDWHGDAASQSYMRRHIAGPHFADFERHLDQARQAGPADGFKAVFNAFKKGLQVYRQGRPVVLILDQISQNDISPGGIEVTPQDFAQGLLDQILKGANDGDEDMAGIFPLLILPLRPGAQVLPFDNDTYGTQVDPQTMQRLTTSNRIPEYIRYGLSELKRFRVLHVPGLRAKDADANNLFDEFADFQTNDRIESVLRKLFKAAAEYNFRDNDTDEFVTLERYLKIFMQVPTAPM